MSWPVVLFAAVVIAFCFYKAGPTTERQIGKVRAALDYAQGLPRWKARGFLNRWYAKRQTAGDMLDFYAWLQAREQLGGVDRSGHRYYDSTNPL